MREGLVFDFHRGTTHDGPGMRTTVFFKGCPLRCEWCHNPESICPERELQWDEKKCIGCGNCVKSCPVQAIKATAEGIKIQHDCCAHCYQCAQQCPSGAMGIAGEYWSAETLIKEVCKDKIFFDEFSGGVTVSGGEPILQHEFLTEFLKKLKKQDINIALDTSGFGSRENYEKIYPYVDIFLYDIKFIDKELHKKYTNVSNDIILDNLEYLAQKMRVSKDKKLWIRTAANTESDSNTGEYTGNRSVYERKNCRHNGTVGIVRI